MVWIFAIVTIALLAVFTRIILLFQKRLKQIKSRQDPVRRRIENHYSEMEKSFNRIEDAVVNGMEEIGLSIDQLRVWKVG